MADREKQDTTKTGTYGNPLAPNAYGYSGFSGGAKGKANGNGTAHGPLNDEFTVEGISSEEKSSPFPSSLANWGTQKWPPTKGGER